MSGNVFYGATAIQSGAGGIQNNYFHLATADPVEAAARDLARTVLAQWRDEARLRGLFDPVPIPVPWRAVRDSAFGDHPHLTGGAAEGSGADLAAFAQAFRALRQRRMVVLGEAGSGKTTLAMMLVIELTRRMRTGDAVPVLLPIASWRPGDEHLHTWLEHRLLREYPQLTAETARELISDQRILPVLDGLDELPPGQRPVALKSLNDALAAGGSLVLTCRTGAYTHAVREASILRSAAVVRAEPLSVDAASDYLRSSATPQQAARWEPVLDALARQPDGILAQSLSVPLLLWLARVTYQAPDTRPGELADPVRFPDARAVELHLLDALVPAVYPDGPAPPRPRGRRLPPGWGSGAAERCLGALATHLTVLGSEDFSWWELSRASVRRPRLRAACVVALMLFWLLLPLFAADELTPIGEAYGPVFLAYAGCLFLGATLRIMDSPTRGRVRLSDIRPLMGLVLFPMGWLTVLSVGFGVAIGADLTNPVMQFLVLAGGLAAATVALLLFAWLVVNAGTRVDRREASTPHSSLAVSRRRTLAAGCGLAVLVALFVAAPALATMPADSADPYSPAGTPVAPAIRLAVITATFAVPTAVTRSPWAAYVLSRSLLAARGLTPWRLGRFLADAHRRGVLRQTGSVYQFRHAKLRDRLAERYAGHERVVPAGASGQDALIRLDIDPEEAVAGTVKQIRLATALRCDSCGGSGARAGASPEVCGTCGGDGRVRVRRTLTLRIPPGVSTGTRIRLAGEGEVGPRGGPPGDLYVEINELKHR